MSETRNSATHWLRQCTEAITWAPKPTPMTTRTIFEQRKPRPPLARLTAGRRHEAQFPVNLHSDNWLQKSPDSQVRLPTKRLSLLQVFVVMATEWV